MLPVIDERPLSTDRLTCRFGTMTASGYLHLSLRPSPIAVGLEDTCDTCRYVCAIISGAIIIILTDCLPLLVHIMANRRGKKKCSPTEPSCSITDCNDPSTDIFTCSTCKSPYHITCCNLDAELIPILERNTNEGLTWYARCNDCVANGIPDPASLKPLILDISNTISSKIDEFRALIDMSSLLDIGTTLKNKVADFKSTIDKSGLVVPITQTPVLTSSVEIQTDRKSDSCSIASQTIYPSKAGNSVVAPSNTLSFEENVPSSASFRPQKVCPHYKRGKCRHGASGKLSIDGNECPFIHPRKCLKY